MIIRFKLNKDGKTRTGRIKAQSIRAAKHRIRIDMVKVFGCRCLEKDEAILIISPTEGVIAKVFNFEVIQHEKANIDKKV